MGIKAYQRQIREAQADNHPVPKDFSTAEVREIPMALAKTIILKYEWLGNMGSSRRAFGLFFGDEIAQLAGVECFGVTAGTNTAASVCGVEHADKVLTLVRGACVHWAHPHSASFLINQSCRLLAEEGFHIFVAYSDSDAGEIGTVYQASNWLYCGKTTAGQGRIFRDPNGKMRDERCLSTFARERSTKKDGLFFPKPTRKEVMARMLAAGFESIPRTAKHRYVGIYGDKRMRRTLIGALRWPQLPYPKREVSL